MTKADLRRFLWTAVLVVPIPVGAYAVHTVDSILISAAAYFLLALFVPCFALAKRGGEDTVRAAAHPVTATCLIFPFYLAVFTILVRERITDAPNMFLHGAWALVSMTVVLAVIMLADELCLRLHRKMSETMPAKKEWLTFSFYTGLIPAVMLISLAILAFSGLDRGYASFFFLASGMVLVLYLKIALAMAAVAFYLYLGSRGNKWVRLTRAALTGFFWLVLVWIPMLISYSMETYGAWRLYLDPSYLVIFPILSDLWLSAAALWLGKKVTNWIFVED